MPSASTAEALTSRNWFRASASVEAQIGPESRHRAAKAVRRLHAAPVNESDRFSYSLGNPYQHSIGYFFGRRISFFVTSTNQVAIGGTCLYPDAPKIPSITTLRSAGNHDSLFFPVSRARVRKRNCMIWPVIGLTFILLRRYK